MRFLWGWEVSGQLRGSEPKDEPIDTSQQSSEAFLAWLPAVELIGRIAVVELDLEEETGVAEEQRQHRDPGAD